MSPETNILSEVSQTKTSIIIITYMWNLKSNISKLIYETKRLTENKHMVTKGEGSIGINQEFGINIYTLLHIKQMTNKDLPYSTGNYIQYNNL